jgi:hypothetical protein
MTIADLVAGNSGTVTKFAGNRFHEASNTRANLVTVAELPGQSKRGCRLRNSVSQPRMKEVTIADGQTITIAGGILAALVTAGSAIRRWIGVLIAALLLIVPLNMKELPPG